LILEKSAIAGGTIRNAAADILLLARNGLATPHGTAGDDDRTATVVPLIARDGLDGPLKLRHAHYILHKPGTKGCCLGIHAGHQFLPGDLFRHSRIVDDAVSQCVRARARPAVDDERAERSTRRIQGGG